MKRYSILYKPDRGYQIRYNGSPALITPIFDKFSSALDYIVTRRKLEEDIYNYNYSVAKVDTLTELSQLPQSHPELFI